MPDRRRPPARRGGRGPVDPARLAAFEVLRAVRVDDAYANLVLPHALASHALTGRDAAFATELASGTLRMRGLYDAVLAACVDRPLAKVEAKVLDCLRLGTHQLLSMRVPDHAAISTTVDLVKSRSGAGAGSFANAVLRRVASRTAAEWVSRLAPASGHERLALEFSHPEWEVDLLAAAVGEGEVADLLAADNAPPRVVLVARPGLSVPADLPGSPTPFSPYGVVLDSGSPADVAAVVEGRAGVQDEGSQLVAIVLAEAPLHGPDARWLDLCAGPGGKAALLAALAGPRGATVVANEAQPHRAGLVLRNLTTAPHGRPSSLTGRPAALDERSSNVEPASVPEQHWLFAGAAGVVAADGRRPPFRPGSFDRVLVDAPCTGLGALRRRPEARWRRRPEDVEELVPLQRALLGSALDLVRPGGVVLYATCSPVLAETAGVVEAVLADRADVMLEPVTGVVAGVPDSAGPLPGTVQLWPHRHGTDAMFMALLRKWR